MNREYIKAKLATLPMQSGCYLMKNKADEVIYVGKAKKLKNRVNQYFHGTHNYKTTKMVSSIEDFEYIVTNNEKEALILENNLIKKYRPRFNILMMDDKTYPYLKLTKGDDPRLMVVRNCRDRNARYFGPYSDQSAAYDVMKLVNRLYPLRKCANIPKKACLYYHLKECLGPCINKIEQKQYDDLCKEITAFLNGDTKDILKKLEAEMKEAADNLDFEKAKSLRDLMIAIQHVSQSQKMEGNQRANFDVFDYVAENGYISIAGLLVRKGKLLERQIQIFEIVDEPEEMFMNFLLQYYENNLPVKELYIHEINNIDELSTILDMNIIVPQRGDKLNLLKLANNNAHINLQQKFEVKYKQLTENEKCQNELSKLISIEPLKRIEIFDNSHISGTARVSGMIVVENGEFKRNEYRHFNIKSDAKDDISMMKEVIYRRYYRLMMEDKELPDLILMDGGMLQVNAAKEIINNLELKIPVFGLAKDAKHNTAKLVDEYNHIYDIDVNSDLFFFLTRLQDEVHRFAINFHKNQRSKKMIGSFLDNIDGIGEARKKALYSRFKSQKGIEAATIEELEEVLPSRVAKNLYLKIHSGLPIN